MKARQIISDLLTKLDSSFEENRTIKFYETQIDKTKFGLMIKTEKTDQIAGQCESKMRKEFLTAEKLWH